MFESHWARIRCDISNFREIEATTYFATESYLLCFDRKEMKKKCDRNILNIREITFKFFSKTCLFQSQFTNFFSLLSFCTVWKSTIKCDHDFYGKINIFSVKSTFLLKKLLRSWFHEFFLRDHEKNADAKASAYLIWFHMIWF